MAMNVKIVNATPIDEDKLHFIPAEIQHNGQANVASYFESTIRNVEEKC